MHTILLKKMRVGLEETIRSKRQEIRSTIQLLWNFFHSKKAFFLPLISCFLLLGSYLLLIQFLHAIGVLFHNPLPLEFHRRRQFPGFNSPRRI